MAVLYATYKATEATTVWIHVTDYSTAYETAPVDYLRRAEEEQAAELLAQWNRDQLRQFIAQNRRTFARVKTCCRHRRDRLQPIPHRKIPHPSATKG